MDAESNPQSACIADDGIEVKVDKVRINQGPIIVNSIFFILAFAGHIVTIVLGVPMFSHCHNVALVVMILGSVFGILQVNINQLNRKGAIVFFC